MHTGGAKTSTKWRINMPSLGKILYPPRVFAICYEDIALTFFVKYRINYFLRAILLKVMNMICAGKETN